MFSLFKLFKNKENIFSYENQTKTKFENKENEFTIFNILYMNQKTVMCCFPCFRIKSKTRDLVDWDKTKTQDFIYESLTSFSRKWFYKADFLILYF